MSALPVFGFTNLARAAAEYGSVGTRNGKMPGSSYAVTTTACKVGGKLQDVKGSTCAKCYAVKIERRYPSVAQGWAANAQKAAHWIAVNPDAIVTVANATPLVAHWLPTREAAMVKAYLRDFGPFPPNLVVRVSSTMVDDAPIKGHSHTSTVHTPGRDHAGTTCEARTRGNVCGPCRACWAPSVANVSYGLH